ncbi:MAG: glycosyltransferase family 39 protein [Acidobacteriota bacterium]
MTKARFVLPIVGLWAVVFLASSGYPPALLDDADTVHAEAARETAETGDWVTLHANKIRYLEKAPLMYWSVAAFYKVLGVSEFSSRLPIALAALGLMLATMMLGRFAFGEKAGFYAALAIGSCVGIFLFTRVLWPDVLLTLFVTMAFYCFLRAIDEEGKSRFAYGIYIFGALGVLTKGLIGAAFPAIIIGAYLLITGDTRRLLRLKLFTGALLFFVIAAPWHIAAGLANPGSLMTGTPAAGQGRGFFWFYFMNEHFLRYIGKRYPADYDTVPLPLFFVLHLVWLFPWSFFLPLVIRDMPRRVRSLDREQKLSLFMAVWAVLIILFFSFSTTQEYYTMPAYPAFAILIGRAIARREEQGSPRSLLITQTALAGFGVLVFAACAYALVTTRQMSVEGDISTALTRNPDAYALSLGHVLDLTPQSLAALRGPLVVTALAFGGLTLLALLLRFKRKHLASNLAITVMMAAFFFCAHKSLAVFEPYLSSRTLAEAITREYKDGEMIVINGEYEGGSSLNFYTRRMVYILNGRSANLEYGSYFQDAPPIFVTSEDLARLWKEPARIYLFTDASKFKELAAGLPAPAHRFAESGGKLILTNRQSN